MKNKILLIIIFLASIIIPCFAVSAEEISKIFDFEVSQDYIEANEPPYIIKITDGFLEVSTFEGEGLDSTVVKRDEKGNIVWKKIFKGSENDILNTAIEVDDGYVVAGYSASRDIPGLTNETEYNRGIIVKFDKDGNILWKKNCGTDNYNYYYNSLIETDDGYLALGNRIIVYSKSDGSIVKELDEGYSAFKRKKIIKTTDGYVYIENNNVDNTGHIVKIDSDGNIIWNTVISNPEGSNPDYLYVESDDLGNYYVSDFDANIYKFNSDGTYDSIKYKIDSHQDEILGAILKRTSDGYVFSITLALESEESMRVESWINYFDKNMNFLSKKIFYDYSTNILDEVPTGFVFASYNDYILTGDSSKIKISYYNYPSSLVENDTSKVDSNTEEIKNPSTTDGIVSYVILCVISICGIILLKKKTIKN